MNGRAALPVAPQTDDDLHAGSVVETDYRDTVYRGSGDDAGILFPLMVRRCQEKETVFGGFFNGVVDDTVPKSNFKSRNLCGSP